MESCKLAGGGCDAILRWESSCAHKRARCDFLREYHRGFLFLLVLPSFLFAAVQRTGAAFGIHQDGQIPGVRFTSGLMVCDEELRNGRWLSRYWDSSGQIIADIQIDAERQRMDTLPVDAFKLEIEGQELSGTWKWIGPTNPRFRIRTER